MSVQRFLQWWTGELLGLLPDALRNRLGAARTLLLPPELTLHRVVDLPLAAERNLRAAVALEMDRYTPFAAEAVHFACRVLSRDPASGRMQVALAAVPRAQADPVIAGRRSAGAAPAWLDLGAGLRVPLEQRTAGGRRVLFAVAAASALAAVVYAPLAAKQRAVEDLEAEARVARAQAAAAGALQRRLDAARAEERAVLARRTTRAAALELVDELTRRLPDGTWLTHLELAGSRLRLRGESSNAAELPAALDGSPLIAGAALDGALTREPGSARERFTLTAGARAPVPR